MRQYGVCAIVLGAAPIADSLEASGAAAENFAHYAAKIIDQAGHSYSYGLRAYYSPLSILAWFINTWMLALAVAVVVAVLFAHEFHFNTLQAMIAVSRAGLSL